MLEPQRCLRAAIAIVLLPLALGACMDKAEPPAKEIIRPVRAMKVADATQLKGRTFSGKARAVQEVELSFRVSGPLITLPAKVGDDIKKGDIVARIDPRDYEVQVNNVQAQMQQAKAVQKRTAADLKRLDGVRAKNPGFVSQLDYDTAVQNRDGSIASVSALEASVQGAKDKVDYTYLRAPFDGIVVDTYVENFEDVRAQQPILRIVDHSRIEFVVNIPENLISLTPSVVAVEVTFDALPDTPVAATIKEIGTEASAATRTYPVTLIMDQPKGARILPGMAGKARGEPSAEAMPKGVEVPASSVFAGESASESFVWVIDGAAKTVSKRSVKADEVTERGLRVSNGLKAGEWIATAGVHYLREGQQVRILEQPTE